MKSRLFFTLAFFLLLSSLMAKSKVMKRPACVFNGNGNISIERVEFRDTATVINFYFNDNADPQLLFSSQRYLEDEHQQRYNHRYVLDKKGKPILPKYLKPGNSYYFVFDPMPRDVNVFDIHFATMALVNNPRWHCWGVHDRKVALPIYKKDFKEAECRLLQSLSTQGVTKIKGCFCPSKRWIPLGKDTQAMIADVCVDNGKHHSFTINQDSTFEVSIPVTRPQLSVMGVGDKMESRIPLFLVPNRETYVEIKHPLDKEASCEFSDSTKYKKLLQHFSLYWLAKLPAHYTSDLKAAFIDSRNFLDSVNNLGWYLIDKYKMNDEEGALLHKVLSYDVFYEQMRVLGREPIDSLPSRMHSLRQSLNVEEQGYLQNYLYSMLDDKLILLCHHARDIQFNLNRILKRSLKGMFYPQAIHKNYTDRDSVFQSIFAFSQLPFFLKYTIIDDASFGFSSLQESVKEQCVDELIKCANDSCEIALFTKAINANIQKEKDWNFSKDVSMMPGYKTVEKFQSKHKGKYLLFISLMTCKDDRRHEMLDNIIHDFAHHKDVAIIFVANNDWVSQGAYNDNVKRYLKDYEDCYLLDAHDYYELAFLDKYPNVGEFHTLLFDKNGKLSNQVVSFPLDSDLREYFFRQSMRYLLDNK